MILPLRSCVVKSVIISFLPVTGERPDSSRSCIRSPADGRLYERATLLPQIGIDLKYADQRNPSNHSRDRQIVPSIDTQEHAPCVIPCSRKRSLRGNLDARLGRRCPTNLTKCSCASNLTPCIRTDRVPTAIERGGIPAIGSVIPPARRIRVSIAAIDDKDHLLPPVEYGS